MKHPSQENTLEINHFRYQGTCLKGSSVTKVCASSLQPTFKTNCDFITSLPFRLANGMADAIFKTPACSFIKCVKIFLSSDCSAKPSKRTDGFLSFQVVQMIFQMFFSNFLTFCLVKCLDNPKSHCISIKCIKPRNLSWEISRNPHWRRNRYQSRSNQTLQSSVRWIHRRSREYSHSRNRFRMFRVNEHDGTFESHVRWIRRAWVRWWRIYGLYLLCWC